MERLGRVFHQNIHSLKLTASLPLKIGLNAPKGNHPFSGFLAVSFREGSRFGRHVEMDKEVDLVVKFTDPYGSISQKFLEDSFFFLFFSGQFRPFLKFSSRFKV